MGSDARYHFAAQSAAHIVNVLSSHTGCKAILFSKVLFCILDAMYAAEEEMSEGRYEPSSN